MRIPVASTSRQQLWLVRRRLPAESHPLQEQVSKVAERPVNELSTPDQKAHSRALTFLFVSACAIPLGIYISGPLRLFSLFLGIQLLLRDLRSTMWPSLSPSSLWLAACALAGTVSAVVGEDGIRSIPVCLLL